MGTEFDEAGYNQAYGMASNPNARPAFGVVIGKRVAKELRERGWTQGQLAAKAHCAQPAIAELIAGKTKDPKSSLLIALAAAFGRPVDFFIGPRVVSSGTELHLPVELGSLIQALQGEARAAMAAANKAQATADEAMRLLRRRGHGSA